ncbi:MAG TPA: coenzyme F420-0:L-glutamate ligase [Solirubrobacterales bacterium]|nr:coenzyme F420-0:L-glutamate ligase [Solirubrobacterales bacterium]
MSVEIAPIEGLPEIRSGDSLGELIAAGAQIVDGDVVVISQKAVSKAEGRVRRLGEVAASDRARKLGAELGKDPALVELILEESTSIIRAERGVLIVETRSGWICANAGIDASNVPGDDAVVLLPVDPDASARRIRAEIRKATHRAPAVVVSDSFGRPWRLGQTDVAIGCAGLTPLEDWRGRSDREGRELAATVTALADEIAAAADVVRGKDAGIPAALVRGLAHLVGADDGPGAAALRRSAADDLFR